MGHGKRSQRGITTFVVTALLAGLTSLGAALPADSYDSPTTATSAEAASDASTPTPTAPASSPAPAPTSTAPSTAVPQATGDTATSAPAPSAAPDDQRESTVEPTDAVVAAPAAVVPGSQVDVTVNVSGPATGVAGADFTYVATVGNNSLPDADGTTFTIVAPGGATNVSATCAADGGATCPSSLSVSGVQVKGTAGLLPHNGRLTITVTGRFAAPSPSSVTCRGTVTAPTGTTDYDLTSNSSTVATTVTNATTVTVTQTQTLPSTGIAMAPGTPNTYTLTWTNDGPATADGTVTLAMMYFRTDLYSSANISGFSCTASGGLVCPTVSATSVSGSFGVVFSVTQTTFPAGATMRVTYTADLVPAAPQRCGSSTTAIGADVRATVPNGFTNTGTTDMFVYANAPGTPPCPTTDLAVTKKQSQTTIAPGSPVTYTVTYRNAGLEPADGASLVDALYFGPPVQSLAIQVLSCDATSGAVCPTLSDKTITSSGSTVVQTTAPSLPPGGEIRISYTASATVSATPPCSPSGSSSVENRATITVPAGMNEAGPGPNQASVYATAPSAPTCPRATLTATTTVDKGTLFPGDPTTYTVTYKNNGPDPADGATITDYLELFRAPFINNATVTIVSCTGTNGASCPSFVTNRTVTNDSYLWSGSVGAFPKDATLTIVAKVDPTPGGSTCPTTAVTIPSTARITLPGGMTGANGSAAVNVTAACADIAVNKSIDHPSVQPGDPVTYTVKVSNASVTAARSVQFSDPLPRGFVYASAGCQPSSAASTCVTPTYDTGTRTLSALIPIVGPNQGYVTFTITGRAGPVGGTYSNTATAGSSTTGADRFIDPVPASNTSTAVLTIFGTASTVTVTKALTGLPAGGVPAALTFRGSITCDYEGTRPWTVTVPAGAANASANPVAFYDGQQCQITENPPPALPTGYTWVGAGQVDPAELAITGPSSSYAVTVTNRLAPNAVLQLAKTVSRTQATAGQEVTFTYQVTNGGAVAVDDPVIHETSFSGSGPLAAPTCPAGELAPGASVSCSTTYTVTDDDVATGLLTNAAYATATPRAGPGPTTATATASVRLVQAPALSLTKTASPATVSAPGQEITYTYEVTNTGGLPLTNPVVTESSFSGSGPEPTPTCPATADTLGVGDTATCTATYTTTQADIDAGGIDNTAVASASAPDGFADPTSTPDSARVDAAQSPAIALAKSVFPAAPTTFLPGTVVTYSFVVTNTGNVTVSAVRIDEVDFSGAGDLAEVACPVDDLAPGDQLVCSVDYEITAGDTAAGSLSNSATAVGTPPSGPDVRSQAGTAVIPDSSAPAVEMVKDAAPTVVRLAGDQVRYTFEVTNTGNVPVTALRVDETAFSGAATIPVPVCPGGLLLPGQTVTCEADYVATGADLSTEAITNTATATVLAPDGSTVVSEPSTASVDVVPGIPELTLTKSASPPTISAAGQLVTFTIEATNTGQTPLEDVHVTDTGFTGTGPLSTLDCPDTTTLAVGEQLTCTATYTTTQADVDAGGLVNLARVVAYVPGDVAETPVSDDADAQAPAGPDAALSLTKSASPSSPEAFRAGVPVTYTFVLTNTGTVTLSDATVVEGAFDGTGTLSPPVCPPGSGVLVPGAQLTCTATYTLTQADIDHKSVTNSAQAVANPPTGPPVHSDDATASLPAEPAPALSLVKLATPSVVDRPGEVVTYTFEVTNTGNVTLGPVTIDETRFDGTGGAPATSCPAATLAPGQTLTCTARYAVTDADMDRTVIDNTATASATYQTPTASPFALPTARPLAAAEPFAPPVVLAAPLADAQVTSVPSSARVIVSHLAPVPPGPSPTPAPEPPAVVNPSSSVLATTGSDLAEIATAAALVLLVGVLALVAARHRRKER